MDRGDAEFIDIGAIVVLGVGDRGLKCFLEYVRGFLWCERQDIKRLCNRLATDQIRDKACFLGGNMDATNNSCSFHPLPLGLLVRGMTLESTGTRELAQLVAKRVIYDLDVTLRAAINYTNFQ